MRGAASIVEAGHLFLIAGTNRTIDQNQTTSNITHQLFGMNVTKNQLMVPQGGSGIIQYDSAGNLTKDTYSSGAI